MAAHEDVITLIVQRDNLPSLKVWLRRETLLEHPRSEQTQRRAEVVQDQLGPVTGCATMTGKPLALDPVADAEVKGRADGQMHDYQAAWLLLVLLQDNHAGEVAVRGELGDLADGELVRVAVCRTTDIHAVREQVGQDLGFVVEGGVDGGRNKDLGGGRGFS